MITAVSFLLSAFNAFRRVAGRFTRAFGTVCTVWKSLNVDPLDSTETAIRQAKSTF